jgi:hypothetical protein
MHRLSIISIRGSDTSSLPRLIVAAFLLFTIAGPLSCDVLSRFTDLPRTDGTSLPPPPSVVSPEEGKRLFADSRLACEGPCETPFGQVLGVADGAEARSNCVSTCVQPEFSFLDLETGAISVSRQSSPEGTLSYIGITYQCVAYARQWWMKNLTLSFGDVDNAYHIFYLTEGINPRTGDRIPLGRSVNGSARRPPQRGDLVIYAADRSDPDWRSGHVAVVVAVDRERGLVALAEENYDNRPWQNPQAFARQIQLFEINGRFTLLDVSDGARRNPHGGQIVGWVYPTP